VKRWRSDFARLLAPALAALALIAAGCGGRNASPAPERAAVPAPQRPGAVLLISLDGFRPDYLERIPTPHLNALAALGVRARWMTPPFPAKTFPSHYTIATGLLPVNHGIVSNNFYDPLDGARFRYSDYRSAAQSRWWLGEPLWVTAERQGVRAFSYFWPGSDAEIAGVRPSRWKQFDGAVPDSVRVDSVLAWLALPAGEAPRFVTLYMSETDHWGHERGPDSPELRAAVIHTDAMIGRLVAGLRARGLDHVNLVVVSDHGMIATHEDRAVFIEEWIDTAQVTIVDLGPFISLRPRRGVDAAAIVTQLSRAPHIRVYRREQTPERWRYRGSERVSGIVGVPDDGWMLTTRRSWERRGVRRNGGEHGYDFESPGMRALFIASGPAFRSGALVEPFQALHVYELVCRVLGLRPAPNDGSLDSVRAVLEDRGIGGAGERGID
jgi:predicted AlkP superfamily pyrophosphatase or phosphodiesterase